MIKNLLKFNHHEPPKKDTNTQKIFRKNKKRFPIKNTRTRNISRKKNEKSFPIK